MKTRILRSLAMLALLLVVACGGGISQDSYDKIKDGMTLEEVEAILGKHTGGGGAGGERHGGGGHRPGGARQLRRQRRPLREGGLRRLQMGRWLQAHHDYFQER